MRSHRLWRYVLRYDGGLAPHIAGGLCSLACCKPKIRRYAVRGDWILGFVPARESRGRALVRYAMVVTEDPLPFAEYWRNHRGRRDALYRPHENRLVWVENDRRDHPDGRAHKTDISGINALVSDRFWYFGVPGEELYGALRPQFQSDGDCEEATRRIFFGGRGQKYNGLAPGDFACVKAWLEGVPVDHSDMEPESSLEAAARGAEKRRGRARCATRA
jgi:putative DNA base modification enzyme with NMAD domain